MLREDHIATAVEGGEHTRTVHLQPPENKDKEKVRGFGGMRKGGGLGLGFTDEGTGAEVGVGDVEEAEELCDGEGDVLGFGG